MLGDDVHLVVARQAPVEALVRAEVVAEDGQLDVWTPFAVPVIEGGFEYQLRAALLALDQVGAGERLTGHDDGAGRDQRPTRHPDQWPSPLPNFW